MLSSLMLTTPLTSHTYIYIAYINYLKKKKYLLLQVITPSIPKYMSQFYNLTKFFINI